MKKFLTINLLLIILLNSIGCCFAVENQTYLVKHKGDCKLYLKYKGAYKQVHYAAYENNGVEFPAYCLNPEADGVGSGGRTQYNVVSSGKITNENIWKVLINGYPYKSLEELGVESANEAYSATQAAVYTALENRDTQDYEADSSSGGKRTLNAYLKIMEAARNSKEVMNTKIEIQPISESWKIDENDNKSVSKIYVLNSNMSSAEVNIKVNNEILKVTDINGNAKSVFATGENFKIIVPIETLIENIEFEISANSNFNTKPIWYGKTSIEGTQNYALTGSTTENIETNYRDLVPKNTTKLIIIKQEKDSDIRLEGVKFNLLNANDDVVSEDLITNENGQIVLENLIPGTYYLKEIKTLENYNLKEEVIEINLGLNEEKEIIVENSIKEIPKIVEPENEEKISDETPEIIEQPIKQEIIKEEIVKKEIVKIEEVKRLPITGY